jgi:hypothetical protein
MARLWLASRRLLPLLAVLLLPAAARAQTETTSIDLARAAERLADAIDELGLSRVAVMPIPEPAARVGLGAMLTSGLQQALSLVRVPVNHAIEVVPLANVVAASTRPSRSSAATETVAAARQAGAQYVVVSTLAPIRSGHRLQMRMYRTDTGRNVRTVSIEIPTVTGLSRPVVNAMPPEPFWTSRRLTLFAGYLGAGAAAAMAIRTDRDLRMAKRDLLAIPAGATDLWNAQLREATGIEKTRDFWWGAAVGLAGLSTAYLVVRSSPDLAPHAAPAGDSPHRSSFWTVRINPVRAQVLVSYSFR